MLGAIFHALLLLCKIIGLLGGAAFFTMSGALYFGVVNLLTIGEWYQLAFDKIELAVGSVSVAAGGMIASRVWSTVSAMMIERRRFWDGVAAYVTAAKVHLPMPADASTSSSTPDVAQGLRAWPHSDSE